MDRKRRRLLIGAAGALSGLATPSLADLLDPTPRQTRGPFYPRKPPLEADNDLIRVDKRGEPADGIFTEVTGRILDPSGEPIDSARVEIWQCDANGRYHHARARPEGRDPNFQGFGAFTTDTDGRYRFRTIRPVPYPGRTPHVHFRVVPPEMPELVTQMYIADHPMNADDAIFRAAGADRHRLAVAFQPAGPESGVELLAHFDIVAYGRH